MSMNVQFIQKQIKDKGQKQLIFLWLQVQGLQTGLFDKAAPFIRRICIETYISSIEFGCKHRFSLLADKKI